MVHILIWLVFAATSGAMRRPRGGILLCFIGGEKPGGESRSVSFGKHTAKLNGWSINFSGIDLHQFCLHAHTLSHSIVNQSFWKHLTEEPVLTNKPSIPTGRVAPLSGHKSTNHTNICSVSIVFPALPRSVSYPSSVPGACLVLMACLARRGCESSPQPLR